MSDTSNVAPLPLTRARATEIQFCLREGYVLEEIATLDEFGNWRFHIARVCAGLNIEIEVALEPQGPHPRLFVLEIQGDEIR